MDSLKIVIGFILMLAGSQIYWLVIAVAGFIIGDYVEVQSIRFLDNLGALRESVKYSLLGVILSIAAKPVAILTAGFTLGGFLCFNLPDVLGWRTDWFGWPYFVLAGSIVALLMFFFYAYTMILVTSLSGAVIIIQNTNLASLTPEFMLLLFVVLGFASQFLLSNYNEPTLD
jgi:hypothetical protein